MHHAGRQTNTFPQYACSSWCIVKSSNLASYRNDLGDSGIILSLLQQLVAKNFNILCQHSFHTWIINSCKQWRLLKGFYFIGGLGGLLNNMKEATSLHKYIYVVCNFTYSIHSLSVKRHHGMCCIPHDHTLIFHIVRRALQSYKNLFNHFTINTVQNYKIHMKDLHGCQFTVHVLV